MAHGHRSYNSTGLNYLWNVNNYHHNGGTRGEKERNVSLHSIIKIQVSIGTISVMIPNFNACCCGISFQGPLRSDAVLLLQ